MDTMKLVGKKPKMIAHRGVSHLECENTCPAFVAAGNRSYYGIETDMHMTKDGKFVVCHDSDLSRVGGGSRIIEEETLEELQKIRLTCPHSGESRSDYFIPTLTDYINICKKYEKEAVLEIKGEFGLPATEKYLREIHDLGYIEHTTFISFYPVSLAAIRLLYPAAKVQFLTLEASDEVLALLDKYNYDLDIRGDKLTPEFFRRVKEHGHLVNIWTVDRPEDGALAQQPGVDFITSNILE